MSGDVEMKDGETEWVRIRSNDGYSFILPRKAAQVSGTIRTSLDKESGFAEARENTATLDSMRAVVTEKVLEYLVHKAQYEKAGPKEEIPDFTERIVPELALEMLMAADFLDT